MWNILHITDMHLSSPELSGKEHLRIGYYKEYLNDLTVKCEELGLTEIDCLVITGDFIDKGKVENFEHAKNIIAHLSNNFHIRNENIVVCNGNHDLIKKYEESLEHEKSREPYFAFAKNYANSNEISKYKRALLCSPSADIKCLSLDSCLGNNGSGNPGKLEDDEPDAIISMITENVEENDLLIIASHHPVKSNIMDCGPFDENDPAWDAKHLWQFAHELQDRIKKIRRGAPTIWLSGDIHKPAHVLIGNIGFVTTGRIGSPIMGDTITRRQAKILVIPTNISINTPPTAVTAEFNPPGHNPSPIGDWKIEKNLFQIVSSQSETNSLTLPQDNIEASMCECQTKNTSSKKYSEHENVIISLIDEELENIIIESIKNNNLYIWGRFHAWKDMVSLAWVPMGPLLNDGEILSHVISKMSLWVKNNVFDYTDSTIATKLQDTIFVGTDCWGSIIASQLSFITGIRNFCIASRAMGSYCSHHEGLNPDIINSVSSCKNIVFIVDVVGSGSTIKYLHETFSKQAENDAISWYVLSIISDKKQKTCVSLNFLKNHGTACHNLRMPHLRNEELPDASILPPNLAWCDEEV